MYTWRFQFWSVLGFFALYANKSLVVERGLFRKPYGPPSWAAWYESFPSCESGIVRTEIARRMSLAAVTGDQFVRTERLLKSESVKVRQQHLRFWADALQGQTTKSELTLFTQAIREGWNTGDLLQFDANTADLKAILVKSWVPGVLKLCKHVRSYAQPSRSLVSATRAGLVQLIQEHTGTQGLLYGYRCGYELRLLHALEEKDQPAPQLAAA